MQSLLAFWKPSTTNPPIDPPRVYQELYYGEDVEGLIDLPIQEILADLKTEFPQHEERAGILLTHGALGPLEWNWSWQHVRVAAKDLAPEERERILGVLQKYGCGTFDVPTMNWVG